MIGSKKHLEATREARRAKYIVNGHIDHDAIRKEAEATADRTWTGKHLIYRSKDEMVEGFIAGIMKDLK